MRIYFWYRLCANLPSEIALISYDLKYQFLFLFLVRFLSVWIDLYPYHTCDYKDDFELLENGFRCSICDTIYNQVKVKYILINFQIDNYAWSSLPEILETCYVADVLSQRRTG